MELLENMMGAQPTAKELQKWAARSPDRWAHAIEIFAKLGGFTEKKEVTHSFIMNLMNMGDAEIQQALVELEAEEGSFKEVSVPLLSAPESAPDISASISVTEEDWFERPRPGIWRKKKRGALAPPPKFLRYKREEHKQEACKKHDPKRRHEHMPMHVIDNRDAESCTRETRSNHAKRRQHSRDKNH